MKSPDNRMDEVGFTGHLSAALFLSLTSPHHRAASSFPGVSFQLLPVCCWSKFSISSLLFWCISLPLAEWAVVLLSVWKGCQEPSQALRKHRNCRRLCAASASSFSPVGWGKRAGYDIELQSERNKCGIPHSFHSV